MIYGIGLPRTGTASLAESLRKMGKKTTHCCVLHDDDKYNEGDIEASVDNSFYRTYNDVALNDDSSLFILTTRKKEDWDKSISRFSTKPTDLPDIDVYEEEVRVAFKSIGSEDRLLVVNMFENEDTFKKISEFLGLEHQETKMPHAKRELNK